MLQIPELKRAMGFDSAFAMRHGLRRDKIMILGNAVSPPVITGILQRMCGDALKPAERRRSSDVKSGKPESFVCDGNDQFSLVSLASLVS